MFFVIFFLTTKIGEKNAQLFPDRKKVENFLLFLLREKKERNKNNQEGVLDYSFQKEG